MCGIKNAVRGEIRRLRRYEVNINLSFYPLRKVKLYITFYLLTSDAVRLSR